MPRLIQCSGSTEPLLRSTEIMYDGRSRVPVRTGLMYSGHWYTPLGAFFFACGCQKRHLQRQQPPYVPAIAAGPGPGLEMIWRATSTRCREQRRRVPCQPAPHLGWLEVDDGHGLDEPHGLGLAQVAPVGVPPGAFQVDALDVHALAWWLLDVLLLDATARNERVDES